MFTAVNRPQPGQIGRVTIRFTIVNFASVFTTSFGPGGHLLPARIRGLAGSTKLAKPAIQPDRR